MLFDSERFHPISIMSFKNIYFVYFFILICESSSYNHVFGNNADSEEACFTEPKAKTETAMQSVIHDSIDNPDDLSTRNSEQILGRFPRSEESASTFEETNDASPDEVNDPHLGPFSDYPSNSKTVVIVIICGLLSFCFIYSICRCWFDRQRNINENEPESSSSDPVTEDFDSLHNISIGNAITTRTRHLMEFFRNPILNLTRDYEVNVSTLNVANLSFSTNSEGEQSSNTRSETSSPFECDPDDDLTDMESSNVPTESCREKVDEGPDKPNAPNESCRKKVDESPNKSSVTGVKQK